jgi:hypothetical protein
MPIIGVPVPPDRGAWIELRSNEAVEGEAALSRDFEENLTELIDLRYDCRCDLAGSRGHLSAVF